MNTYDTIKRIESDFAERTGPFSDDLFPEHRLLNEAFHGYREPTSEDKLTFISLFSTLDYNRDANQLADNITELWEEKWWAFNPADAAHNTDELVELFDRIGFRYPNRDAKAWSENCSILLEHYNGLWHELLLDTGLDAVELINRLEDDGFYCLCGDKIGPMYARIISDEVATLDRLWELDIPVDRHIERLTRELSDDDLQTRADVREWWRVLAAETDVQRHVVDGGLWMIGNQWDQWGEDYWQEVTGE